MPEFCGTRSCFVVHCPALGSNCNGHPASEVVRNQVVTIAKTPISTVRRRDHWGCGCNSRSVGCDQGGDWQSDTAIDQHIAGIRTLDHRIDHPRHVTNRPVHGKAVSIGDRAHRHCHVAAHPVLQLRHVCKRPHQYPSGVCAHSAVRRVHPADFSGLTCFCRSRYASPRPMVGSQVRVYRIWTAVLISSAATNQDSCQPFGQKFGLDEIGPRNHTRARCQTGVQK